MSIEDNFFEDMCTDMQRQQEEQQELDEILERQYNRVKTQTVRKYDMNGVLQTMSIEVSDKQLEDYSSGKGHVQEIFPTLRACEREFLITGMTPETWGELFGGCTWPCNPCPYNVKHITDEETFEDDDEWQGNQS